MKNGLTMFLGVFAIIGASWAVLLLVPHRQYGNLAQFKDPVDETLYPLPLSGLADQGRLVYQDLGCAICHTQQVRRADFGADIDRKWGERQSYARDYLREKTVHLGGSRLGPDLRNVAARGYADAAFLYKLLYAPHTVAPGTNMPAYPFLFDLRRTGSAQSSPLALALTGRAAPPAGYEVVPTRRAQALAAYLLSLKDTYDYPVERAKNTPPAPEKKGGH